MARSHLRAAAIGWIEFEFEFGASVLRRRFRREDLRGGRRGQGAGVGDGMAAREGGRRLACLGAVAAAHGRRRS